MAKNLSTKIEISAVDQASAVVKKVGKEFDAFGKQVDKVRGNIGGAFSGLGAGALGAVGGGLGLGAVLRQAGDFEYALYQTTKVTNESTDSIKEKIQSLPAALGSATELTQGYYQVMSAGVTDSAKAMETLETASKLASVAEVTQGEAIQALTKMMAGFRGEIANTSDAADLLLDIEEKGQTNVRELIPVIGDLSSMSQTLGVSYKEMAASLSLLTQTAGSTSQAATQLRALELSLIKPTENMQKLLGAMGYKSGQELVAQNGLAGALELVRKAAAASGMEISKFMESQEALMGYYALSSGGFAAYENILQNIGTQTGRTTESFDKFMLTFRGVEAQGLATFKNLSSIIGDEFLPSVKNSLTDFNTYLATNTEEVKTFARESAETFGTLKTNIGGVVDVWRSLPDDITGPAGYGIVGGILFGKTGAVLGLALSLSSAIQNSIAGAQAVASGQISFMDYALSNKKELESLLTPKPQIPQLMSSRSTKPGLLSSHSQGGTVVTPENALPVKGLPSLPKNFNPISGKGSGAGKTESAMLYLKGINAEIEKMLGTGESFDIKLDKKLDEIARSAKSAGLSMTELRTVQDEYSKAAYFERDQQQSKALGELDLSIARLTGDMTKVRDLELAQELEVWRKKLAELGVGVEDAANRLEKFENAKKKQMQVQDVQAVAQFYQELAKLSGEYATSEEYGNQLIAARAELLRQNGGIMEEDLQKWEKLQLLNQARDPWSGVTRSADRYFSDATNWAENFSGMYTSTMDGLVDASINFSQGSKIAFDDLGRSFMNMLAQMTMKAALSGLFKGIVNIVGGFFTGSTSGTDSMGIGGSGWQGDSSIMPPLKFHDGGIVGLGLPNYFGTRLPASVFVNAPRLHNGGGPFGPNEYPAVLLKNERVLNPKETQNYAMLMENMRRAPTMPQAYASPQITINPTIIDRTERGVTVEMKEQHDNNGNVRLEYIVGDMAAKQANTPGSNLNRSLTRNGMGTPAIRR